MNIKKWSTYIFFSFWAMSMSAQKDVTTFGIQFKPIIPSKFFDSGVETIDGNQFSLTKTPKLGYNFGMVIRKGFTEILSAELGINYTRRRFDLDISDEGRGVNQQLQYIFTAYEIPLQGLLYVQLGEQVWMNGAAGFSFDMYPSDLFSSASQNLDGQIFDFEQRTYRSNWAQISLIANYGFEYRTKEDGILYLGASYHRPFNDMAFTRVIYKVDNQPYQEEIGISGSYLTVDLRYFFHEDPERKKKLKKSPK